MIADLKADSARWEQERRAQAARNTTGGIRSARDGNNAFSRQSNSPPVSYHASNTRAMSQQGGPPPQDYDHRNNYDAPKYPGSGAPGYSAGPGFNPQGQGSYPYPNQGYPQNQGPYVGQMDPKFGSQSPGPAGYNNQENYVHMAAFAANGGPRYDNQPYQGNPGTSRMVTSAAPPGPNYITSQPPQGNYPNSGYGYNSAPIPGPGFQNSGASHPQDMLYGRNPYSGRTSPPQSQPPPDRYPPPTGPQAPGYAQNPVQYDDVRQGQGSNTRRSDRESDRHHKVPRR